MELRGLEPLASCMPWGMRPFTRAECQQVMAYTHPCHIRDAESDCQGTVKFIELRRAVFAPADYLWLLMFAAGARLARRFAIYSPF